MSILESLDMNVPIHKIGGANRLAPPNIPMDPEFRYFLDNLEEPHPSGSQSRVIGDDGFIYKRSQVMERMKTMKYQEGNKNHPNVYHIGQLKLFFCEMLFLAKYQHLAKLVVYVGAADGYHTTLLAKFFPEHKFHLYDPRDFEAVPSDQIQIFQQFFTDEDAEKYVGQDILYICDIRNVAVGNLVRMGDEKKIETVIAKDMIWQMEWAQIMKPKMSSLKFRLPYHPGTTQYLKGQIYLQPFGPSGTECRLHTGDYETMVSYNNQENDQKFAYFNTHYRVQQKFPEWDSVCQALGLRNNWDIAYSCYVIQYYLKKVGRSNSVQEILKQVLDFHKPRLRAMAKIYVAGQKRRN